MKRLCLLIAIGLSLTQGVEAQRAFSEEKDTFFPQVLARIRALDTEPARKVAFDFENSWNGSFSATQKDQIVKLAIAMQKKGYTFNPDFWYYFSYLAYANTQANLSSEQLSKVLEINEQVLQTMNRKDYQTFLLGLHKFMARRIIGQSRNLLAYTDGGSFTFEMLDDYVPPIQEEVVEEVVEEIVEEPADDTAIQDDPWGDDTSNDDPWANDTGNDPWNSNASDPWADDTSDPWGDTAASDPWGDDSSNDDPWGDNSNDDPWGDDSNSSYDNNWVDSGENAWGYDAAGEVFEEKADRQFFETMEQDYVAGLKSKYIHPTAEGPAIDFTNNKMIIITPHDSMVINEANGKYLLKTRTFAGESAVINWPANNKNSRGAVVNLGQFYIRPDRSDFWSPNATLSFPKLFAGSVKGSFAFKSITRRPRQLSRYPIFTSNEADIDLILPGRNVAYRGGIEISGNTFAGTAVSRKPGRLTLTDDRGNKALLFAQRFEFRSDSIITSDQAELFIIHGSDTLEHPGVSVFYDARSRKLSLLRKKNFQVTPFKSTYFAVNVNAEMIQWDMNTDSVNFTIQNGKDLLPVTIESKDYFSDERFGRLGSGMAFNPVAASVYYANLYRTNEFSEMELADYYKTDIKQIRQGMTILERYGFADYNHETGLVQLKPKAFHFYNASGRKVDFDNFFIPSKEPGLPNITWRLDSGDMKVNGVKRFYLTSDYLVYAEPENQQMTLLKGRNFQMDGMVNAGEFQYKGKNYQFDYEQFLIELNQVDSIRIQVTVPDSLKSLQGDKSPLTNHLNETSGVLYLDDPQDKSGSKPGAYPDFVSNSDAIVYFDGPEVLNGAYDRSVKFIIPPFDADSLTSEAAISFDGTFNSGNVFPDFEETLKLQPDNSLGFIHQIPAEGYNLYGTAARTYEKIRLSNQGMRGGGKIDFITSSIYSDDFVYYPDSVAAYGTGGFIGPGTANGSSYPEAVLGPYRMHWEPRIDSMNLQNIRSPFKFYNATAELDGAVNITSRGVYGIGTMLTRGSRAVSDQLEFKEFSYGARHAEFEILTDNPDKPAMAGDDIRLNFDLVNATALIQPEVEGIAALRFPYAQMRTSITNAVWDLEDSTVTMTKPADVPIESSYFYATREELDSLAFNAEEAVYDFNSRELYVSGIPFIKVADAEIIPENNETTILENFELQSFNHAELIIDTTNKYHYLYDGEIKIISRNEFVGTAKYRLVSGLDTFAIKFNSFVLSDVYVNDKPIKTTVSGGEVLDKDNLIIAPGFYYKGETKMYGYKQSLDLKGSVKLKLRDPSYDYWLHYERTDGNPEVSMDFESALFEDETQPIAGLHYDLRGSIYSTFVESRKLDSDEDFFMAKGTLTYDTSSLTYIIEKPSKSLGESYEGHTYIYNDSTKDVIFEGAVNFFNIYNQDVTINASVLGSGNKETNEYNLNAMLGINFKNAESYMELMAKDLTDIIERLGPPLANDFTSIELLYKLANYTNEQVARGYEKASLKDYEPLHDVSESLEKSLLISGVKLKWSQSHRSFYNTTKLAISNIYDNDVNAKLDGFIEIAKDESNNDVLNIFIQAAPGTWYFIGYAGNQIFMYSSNSDFNDDVAANSNFGKSKPGELVLVLGDETETLTFINEFREKYFGITEPYDLVSPDEISVEDDETFDTIEEDPVDDGFGF
ncbi:MAG: hypothetical protein JXR10_02430 [Cyclobacteriaceae bacterium]